MSPSRLTAIALLAVATAAAAQSGETPRAPYSPSHVFAQVGRGPDAEALTAGLLWSWADRRKLPAGGSWSGLTELSIGRWRGRGDNSNATQVGLAPLLRYHFERWPRLFVEGAIGVNVIAPRFRNGEDRFSTAFNFGDHIGIGWRDAAGALEWTLRYQHFSNAGIRKPNPGAEFVQLRLTAAL